MQTHIDHEVIRSAPISLECYHFATALWAAIMYKQTLLDCKIRAMAQVRR